jgi:hypothetical protein
VASTAQALVVGAISDPDTGAGRLVPKPRGLDSVGRGEVCGLLIGRLQDDSARRCIMESLIWNWSWRR